MAVKLTVPFVENAKGEASRREIGDAIVPGLWLVVQPSGSKSWACRYRSAGKPVKVTLGPYPLIGLADAREQARQTLEKVARGEDPAREKRETKAIVFAAPALAERDLWRSVREEYLKRDAAGLRSHDQIKRLLEKETARWDSRRIQDITKRDVIELLDAVADRGAPVQANRVLAYVRRAFNWSIGRGIVASNPTDGIEAPAEEKSRDRVLSTTELADLLAVAHGLGFPFGSMVRLLVYTGQRLREVAEARWAEFDLDGALWTIPAERAKNDVAHEVPLAPAVVELLRSLPRLAGSPVVLTTTGKAPISGFARAKERVDAALRAIDLERAGQGVRPEHVPERTPWVFHDLRRTAATGLAAEGILFEVIERVLNHKGQSASGLRGIYNRHTYLDEKRRALEAWATRLEVIEAGGANVVSLARRK